MKGEPTTEAEVDAIVAELVAAGVPTTGHDADRRETWTLTDEGARVARMLAMKGARRATCSRRCWRRGE